jgi:hypothetical protein
LYRSRSVVIALVAVGSLKAALVRNLVHLLIRKVVIDESNFA